MSKTMMFEITFARLRGLNLIYFLLTKFSCSHLNVISDQSNAQAFIMAYRAQKRHSPIHTCRRQPRETRPAYLPAPGITFRPRLWSLTPLPPPCHCTALNFQVAFTHLIAFYSVRVQKQWAGTGIIISVWMRKPSKVHRKEGIVIANSRGTLMCQDLLFPWCFWTSFLFFFFNLFT